jgi:hypothetical protein
MTFENKLGIVRLRSANDPQFNIPVYTRIQASILMVFLSCPQNPLGT